MDITFSVTLSITQIKIGNNNHQFDTALNSILRWFETYSSLPK
jgi:hypothetical protein